MPRTARHKQGRVLTLDERVEAQERFLTVFAKSGIILQGAAAAGVDRSTVSEWRRSDLDFARRYDIAEADANDVIRQEIHRRGVTGWTETTHVETTDSNGDTKSETRKVRKFSDAMLKLIAGSRMAEYRDRLDVTSNEQTLGAFRDIERISRDADRSSEACDLLAEIANVGLDAGGLGVDREQG